MIGAIIVGWGGMLASAAGLNMYINTQNGEGIPIGDAALSHDLPTDQLCDKKKLDKCDLSLC